MRCRTSAGPVGPASAVIVVMLNGKEVNGTGGLKFNYEVCIVSRFKSQIILVLLILV